MSKATTSQIIDTGHLTGSELIATCPDAETLIAIIRWRATHQPHHTAIQWLPDTPEDIADTELARLDYATLDNRAQVITQQLQIAQLEHQPAILMYPDGLDFAAALLGCLYAGVIAVPVPPLRRQQGLSSLRHIMADAQVKHILTTRQLEPDIASGLATDELEILLTDTLTSGAVSEAWQAPPIDAETVAFLQYTSGSTSAPKGVIVNHGNLLHNLRLINRRFGNSTRSHGVIWLPYYHDMGLIGGILEPLYGGLPVTLMSPSSFVRHPLRWLQAISHFRATASGGPNFAYEHCLQKITPEQRHGLDLSSWEVAFIGAEPVRADTLWRFAETFADCGFRKTAFYPCYGLAEATLMVSGGWADAAPAVRTIDRASLAQGHIVEAATEDTLPLVSSGYGADETQVLIVNPDTSAPCPPDQVGEIWVSGPGVTQGYWRQPEATTQAFGAYLADGTGPFLRTGDLGALQDNELFVTGRLKDMILIRGQNYYPQDIERTVEESHDDLRPGSGAAFGVDVNGEERLVVVQEVARRALRRLDTAAVTEAIRAAVSRQHGLQVHAVQLLKTTTIHMTSSGKIRRQACKSGYVNRTLDVVGQWPPDVQISAQPGRIEPCLETSSRADDLIQWLRQYAETSINSRQMDDRRSLSPGVVLDFGNQGLLGMQVPPPYGGLGLGHRDMLRVLAQLGAIDPTLALFVGLNNVLGIQPILHSAPNALREELLPRLATGRELAAFALTEPGAGSNPAAISASAWPERTVGWRLRGEKIWSGSAAWAGVINVFVQQRDATGKSLGISGFAVRKGTPGLRQGPEALTMGMRGMIQNRVYLEDVPVDHTHMLGEPGAGMAVAQAAMMYGRLAIAAASVGGMKRCAQLMLRYGSRRTIATGQLLENPIWLSRLNGLTASIAALEALVDNIARRLDQGDTLPQEVYAACKIIAPEFYWQAADMLVQCLGGRGYIETNHAPQILRDAKVLRIFEGPTETMAMFLGARVLYQPAALERFLTQDVHAPAVARTLMETAELIVARYAASESQFEATAARHQACFVIGHIAAFGILLAVVQNAEPDGANLQAAIRWTRGHFESKIAQAQRSTPDEIVIRSAAETSAHIASYEASIGDVEQERVGEEVMPDVLLRRDDLSVTDHPSSGAEEIGAESVTAQTSASLQQWLCGWLAHRLQLSEAAIDPTKAFADYGVDSVIAVELAQALETTLNLSEPLDTTLAWNYPTIEALAKYLDRLIKPSEGAQLPEPCESFTTSLDDLSDAELEAALAAEIAAAQGRRV